MSTNEPTLAQTKSIVIPSDPKTKQAIKSAVVEIDNSMTRIDAERARIADILVGMKEKTEVPGSFIRKMAATYHKQNMDEQLVAFEDFEALYDVIMKN